MIELQEENEKAVTCLLVGKPPKNKGDIAYPYELHGLVHTLDMEIADVVILSRMEPTPAYGIGSGKAREIATIAKAKDVDCIIFDFEIDPTKQRNWEKLAEVPCFDRQEVILRIFASRARTKEAVLQVQLAQYIYSLPRLAHMYGDLARQRGGSYGSKGSGETQLELDRRQIEAKIDQVKKELAKVVKERATQRKKRERLKEPSCALVGYTNAGKSSLLNALTNADVLVENKLFATLDPTTRKLELKNGRSLLLTDTVGFISNLPHSLVDAFKSTLEEAKMADLLLIVIDASDIDAEKQYETVLKVLEEIGAKDKPHLILLNKIDKVSISEVDEARLQKAFPDARYISTKTKNGLQDLVDYLIEYLIGTPKDYIIPATAQDMLNLARQNGCIEKEEWLEDGVHLSLRIGNAGNNAKRALALLEPYLEK
ncbi:MAG: GTPase HflX [Treponema sp.]|nr:GTPase HflX [Treponema sp.]